MGQQIGLYDSNDQSQPFLGKELASGGSKISDYTREEIDKEIKELKSIILELYTIIKAAEDEDNIKIINLTYGTITILLKQILDLE